MNISSDYSVTGNNYEVKKVSADSEPFSIPEDAPKPVSHSGNELQFRGEISKISTNAQNDYLANSAYMQVDSQRKNETSETEDKQNNFLQKYVKGNEEDEEEEEDGRLLDYFLKALKHEEEELVAEGNSYMSDEDKMKLYGRRCPDLFPEFNDLARPSSGDLPIQGA